MNDKKETDSVSMDTTLEEIRKLIVQKEKPFLTVDEASQYLGISKSTLYSYKSQGLIPHYKLQNRKLYFKVEDLDEFILSEKNKVCRK